MSPCKNSKKSGSRHALGGCIFRKRGGILQERLTGRTAWLWQGGGRKGKMPPQTGKKPRVCNFPQAHSAPRFHKAAGGQIMAREGPRKPPAPSLLRNIAKMGHQCFRDTFARFSDNFRPEKRKHRTSQGQTSEVLPRKYGGLWPRSPMFLTHFRTFSASFSRFSAGFSGKSARKPW